MSIRGDFSGLNTLILRVDSMRRDRFKRALSQHLALEAQHQIAEGFRLQRDPYGRLWKRSLRASMRHGQTLSDRGIMRKAWNGRRALERVSGVGFTIANNTHYVKSHQYGAHIHARNARFLLFKLANGRWVRKKSVKLPRRRMIPDTNRWPRIWAREFIHSGHDFASAYLRGRP